MAPRFARFKQLETTGDAIWHPSAPAAVRKAMAREDFSRGWRAWTRHLSERSDPVPPDDLLPAGKRPLRWALFPQRRSRLAEMPDRSPEAVQQWVLMWLDEVGGANLHAEYALDALVLARHLPQLAACLSADAWLGLLAHLIESAGEAGAVDPEGQPLLTQLLAGELPLTLAYLFPELTPCRALSREARQVLSAGLANLLDGGGLLHGRHFGLMRPLLACWTRCLVLGSHMKHASLTATARRRYKGMVRHALRFARHDGSSMLGPAEADGHWRLLRAAVASAGDSGNRAIAARVFPSTAQNARRKPGAALPEVAAQSEWAAAALLRTDWSKSAERLAVVYPGRTVHMELACGNEVLLEGPWSLEVTCDGKRLAPESEWEQVCWVSDDDIDYLELEIELQAGVRVQRQMALAREDRFLFLADAVLGERPGKLEYRACLPLRPGVEFRPAKESREGYLQAAKRRALVFPLALAEWRSLWASGELTATPAALALSQAAKAPALYAPLLFDLDRRRFRRPYTWRRLTVAESLKAVSDDVAVGYRIAVGGCQWLAYRSLAPKTNRTLLGHNLSTEALLARFDSNGEVEPLIEVE